MTILIDSPERADLLADIFALILSWSASEEEEQPAADDESDPTAAEAQTQHDQEK